MAVGILALSIMELGILAVGIMTLGIMSWHHQNQLLDDVILFSKTVFPLFSSSTQNLLFDVVMLFVAKVLIDFFFAKDQFSCKKI